jgi:tRNA (guanine-N7-)-methyltransferase
VAKKKLIHFRENLTFLHLFQPKYHDLIAGFPLRGNWNKSYFRNGHPIVAELGCGKGEYTVGLAAADPRRNFIGIDWKGARLWRGCKTVAETRMENVAFVRTQIGMIGHLFAPGEISEIWITFPDPQVKKERCRLTSPGFLDKYSEIMIPGGIIHLKTDDTFFYEYTLAVITGRGYTVIENITDLYRSNRTDVTVTIRTYYENRWLELGKNIYYLSFRI